MKIKPDEDVTIAINSVPLPGGWFPKLLATNADDLTIILGELANSAKISSYAFKNARTNLRSFSATKWTDFALRFDLVLPDPEAFLYNAQKISTVVFRLPPSFHKRIVEMAWRSQDVYRETHEQRDVATRVTILDTVRN
jgi:hypothetical protein